MEVANQPAVGLVTLETREIPRDGVFVVIPAFNEGSVVGEVINDLRSGYENVVVVDDGSTDDTAGVALSAGARVVRHLLNRGQGAALQTGIEYSLREGAEVVVTFDADGQHAASDLAALIEPIASGRADAVIGSRFLGSAEGIPASRRALLRLAIAFTRITTRAAVTDTHNGLRAMSRRAANRIDLRLDGMAHASEIFDQLTSKQLTVIEVPVHVRYTTYSLRKGQRSLGFVRTLLEYAISRVLR